MAEGQDTKGRLMSDEELRELFSAYIDGQVSGELRIQIEARLDEDEALRAELESLRELVDGLASFPNMSAPDGFAARVMDELDGVDIPSTELRGAAAAAALDQELDALSVPFWLKASIAASLAATVALGFFVLRAPLQGQFETVAAVDNIGQHADAPSFPMGTGVAELPTEVVAKQYEDDAVVFVEAVEEEAVATAPLARGAAAGDASSLAKRRPSPVAAASSPPMPRADQTAAVQGTRSAKRKDARRKGSGLREVSSDRSFPAGVYQADHEEAQAAATVADASVDRVDPTEPDADEDDGVVALAAERQPMVTDLDLAERAAGTSRSLHPARSFSRARGSALAAVPGPASAAPAADDIQAEADMQAAGKVQAEPSSAAGFVSAPTEALASSEVLVVSEEQGGDAPELPSIAAKVAIGTLRVGGPGVIRTLSDEIMARAWSVQNLTPLPEGLAAAPSTGSQVLQITVPQGQEDALSTLLSSYGALNTDRVLAAAHDGNARLRLTVRWGN